MCTASTPDKHTQPNTPQHSPLPLTLNPHSLPPPTHTPLPGHTMQHTRNHTQQPPRTISPITLPRRCCGATTTLPPMCGARVSCCSSCCRAGCPSTAATTTRSCHACARVRRCAAVVGLCYCWAGLCLLEVPFVALPAAPLHQHSHTSVIRHPSPVTRHPSPVIRHPTTPQATTACCLMTGAT